VVLIGRCFKNGQRTAAWQKATIRCQSSDYKQLGFDVLAAQPFNGKPDNVPNSIAKLL
jgi:hypothetical protein